MALGKILSVETFKATEARLSHPSAHIFHSCPVLSGIIRKTANICLSSVAVNQSYRREKAQETSGKQKILCEEQLITPPTSCMKTHNNGAGSSSKAGCVMGCSASVQMCKLTAAKQKVLVVSLLGENAI